MPRGRLVADDTATLFESGAPADKPRGKKAGRANPSANGKRSVVKDNQASVTSSGGKQRTYYLPISQLRAQVFLARGLIFPALYDQKGLPTIFDAQRHVPSCLLLYKVESGVARDELILRIRLTPEEVAEAQDTGDALLVSVPIPIARVTEIVVPATTPNDVQRYIKGWIVPDVPVPSHLFVSAKAIVDAPTAPNMHISQALFSQNVPLEIERSIANYDKVMGLFAYMRNAGRYHSARLGVYADYPAQFFHLAQKLHKGLDLNGVAQVAPSVCLQAILDETTPVPPATAELLTLIREPGVYLDRATAKRVAACIQDATSEDKNVREGLALLFNEDYRSAIRLLQIPPTSEDAVLLAAIYKFSERNTNDRRNLKQSLHEDWTTMPLVPVILGALGAYYGYTLLDARESRLYAVDSRLTESVDMRPPIKFHLDSQFERELVEAIYQWTFHHRNYEPRMSSLFEGLHPKFVARPKSPAPAYWRDDSYQVSDVWVRSYRLSQFARCLQRLEDLPITHLDETTVLGQFLMPAFFFHGDEHGQLYKEGKYTLFYRIRKQKVVDLLVQEKVRVNLKMLQTAIDEHVGAPK